MNGTQTWHRQRRPLGLAAVAGIGLAAAIIVGSAQISTAGPFCPGSVNIPACPPTTTVPSTTIAPTTAPPATTAAPTTVAPTTSAPETVAPPTVAPTTAVAPTTVAETTASPSTRFVSVLARTALPGTGSSPNSLLVVAGLLGLGGAGAIVVTRRRGATPERY